jgi:hypothetical protein
MSLGKGVSQQFLGDQTGVTICIALAITYDTNKDLSQKTKVMAFLAHSKNCAGKWLKL